MRERVETRERSRDETYLLLESLKILGSEGIGLRNDGDEVDSGAKSLHDLDVERLQAGWFHKKQPEISSQHILQRDLKRGIEL